MKKNNVGSYTGIMLLFILILFLLSWKMIIPGYAKDKGSLAQAEKEVEAARAKYESLKTAQESLGELGDIVDQVLVAVPVDEDRPNLIAELEAIGAKHNVLIPNLQINSAAAGTAGAPASNTVGIAFSINGTFETIHSFIASIEKDIKFMNIKALSISGSGDSLSLSLQIESPKRPASALSAASAAAGAKEAP